MNVRTGWLAPPEAIGGIDHLGTQTPCQLIYSQLLPGITNVTDRARYYSLYPWLIWSFDKRYPEANATEFVRLFRRADFLLTLIAHQHANHTQEADSLHGAAMAGRAQLPTVMTLMEENGFVELDDFATRDSVPRRYFKAKLGGLGQYYLGTLVDLQLLDSSKREWVEYTSEFGVPLAEAVDAVTIPDQFWKIVDSGRVTLQQLNDLGAFCPCGLKQGTEEHDFLEALFFADKTEYRRDGIQRRASLAMWLHMARELDGQEFYFDSPTFRSVVYTGHLPNGKSWKLPASLERTREWWGVYQTNELLSLAFQSLFASSLSHLAERQSTSVVPFQTVETLASDLAAGALGDALIIACGTESYAEHLTILRRKAPALAAWSDPEHEQQLGERLLSPQRAELSAAELITSAFELIGLLLCRCHESRSPYAGLAMAADELRRYPINLDSVRIRAVGWQEGTVRAALQDMAHWCLTTHLSVALRKLRQTGRSTFRFRPGERGLELTDDVPIPTRTTPRFSNATQLLVDLGALQARPDGRLQVTSMGDAWTSRHDK